MLENIHRKIEEGENKLKASTDGAKEVFFAIISTSIILISVFLPIIFLKGDTAKLFDELAVTIIGAIFFSTIISLTLTPMLCSKILKSRASRDIENNYIFNKYSTNISKIIKGRFLIPIVFFVLIVISFFLYKNVSKELSPKEDRGAFFLIMNSPEGSSYNNTVKQMLELEEKLLLLNENKEANRVLLRVPRSFSGSENFSDGIGIIVLNHWNERRSIWEIIKNIKEETSNMSDAKIQIFPPRSLGQRRSGSQLQLVVGGDTYEEIDTYMSKILNEVKKNPKFIFVDTDYKKTRPQIKIFIDREKSAELEVSATEIGRTLEVLLGGRKINTFIDNGEEYYVIIQSNSSNRELPEDLSIIKVRSKNKSLIRLDSLIKLEEIATAKELNRYNRIRSITLKAGLDKNYSLGEAIKFLEAVIKKIGNDNVKIDYKGQSKEFKDSSKQLFYIFLISLIVIYLVLSAQFESFIYPLIIIISVPLSLSGGLLGLWFVGSSINIFSQIGMIILMGISAKNGILIVEFANQLRGVGKTVEDAILKACKQRFRPILMTSISTMIGSLPLIFGSGAGSESRLTIGIVVFVGLIVSLILTLFLTPFFYRIIAPYSKK
jgi:multidrug efflux pump